MKRILLSLTLIAGLGATAFAAPSGGTGVGLVAAASYGSNLGNGQVGLSLKLPSMPIYWGLHLSMSSTNLSLGLTGDKYFTQANLISERGFRLDYFIGLGGYVDLAFGSSSSASLGARLPIGLSWPITREFELWLDVAPSLGLSVSPPDFQFPTWAVPAELGLRIWLR